MFDVDNQQDQNQQTDQSNMQDPNGFAQQDQQQQQQQQPDYTRQFEDLNQKHEKIMQFNQQLLNDLQANKQELSNMREQERRRTLLLAGDRNTLNQEHEKIKQEQIRNELLKVVPQLKPILDGSYNQNQGQQQSSVAEMAFFNQARSIASDSLAKRGIADQTAQNVMIRLGDALIHDVPQWHDRFYKQGDTAVLKEVEDFIFKKVFDPMREQIKQETIETIRKQGRFAAPIPRNSGGGGGQQNTKPKNLNPEVRDDRLAAFADMYHQQLTSNE